MTQGFVALPKQEVLFETIRDGAHRIVGFGGGIRGTKTWGSLAAIITLCRIFPRSRWAVVRKDLPRLRQTTIPSFNKLREQFGGFVGEVNQGTWTATCRNGSQVVFFPESLDVDTDWSRWKGLEVNGFLLEEADELAEGSFVKAMERAGAWIVPGNGRTPPPYVLCTFNPCPNWPKRVFYEPWKFGTIKAPYAFIPVTSADNPFISAEQREAWKVMPEQEYRRFVEGDWDVLTGRYYDGLDYRTHIVPRDVLPEQLPAWWEYFGSKDWGYAHWDVQGVWCKSPEGALFLLGSTWARRQQDGERAQGFRALCADVGLPVDPGAIDIYAGHDVRAKVTARGAPGESTQDVYAAAGLYLVLADNDRANGGRAVRRALSECNDARSAGVYLVDTPENRRVFDQLAEVMPDANDVNKPAKVDADAEGRGGDDGADMFRYGVATQVPEARVPAPPDTSYRLWQPDKDSAVLIRDPEQFTDHFPGGIPGVGF